MTEYIYIVKCDDCEDEIFNFFTDARMQCDLVMSKHPIITQVEIERNDFGECTDHHDLGTVWSWEDLMKETDAEPTKNIFTKGDLKRMSGREDPEFDTIDNSVDFEIDETSEVARKPIPEGMSIKELVEAMEENEDTVECVGCEELFPKEDCSFNKEIGWVCPDCEDRLVKCTWCEDLFDKSDCRYEVDLGWLCDHCQSAIMSRGETLTFKEGNYWDFLDESADTSNGAVGKSIRLVYKDSKYHNDGEPYQMLDLKKLLKTCDIVNLSDTSINLIAKFENKCKIIQETEQAYLVTIPCYYRNQQDRSKLEEHPKFIKCWVPKTKAELIEEFSQNNEPETIHDLGNIYDGGYPTEYDLATIVRDSINHLTNDLGKDPWADDFADEVIADLENNYNIDVPEDQEKYHNWCSAVSCEVSRQVNKSSSKLEELEEAADYRKRLTLCPECGDEHSYDQETSFCLSCGFN